MHDLVGERTGARGRVGGDAVRRALALARRVACALLLLPTVARAHTHLVRSDPPANARLTTAPDAIRLWFSETPQLAFTRIHLLAADGHEVVLATLTALPERGIAVTFAGALPAGRYVVQWRTAAADGHVVQGQFPFVVAGPASAAAPATLPDSLREPRPPAGTFAPASGATSAVVPDDAARRARPSQGNALVGMGSARPTSVTRATVTRWVELVALLTLIGAVVFRLFVVPRALAAPARTGDPSDGAWRLAAGALLLLVVAELSRLGAESVAVNGPTDAYRGAALTQIAFASAWGFGWLVGVAGLLVVAIGLALARGRMVHGWWMASVGVIMAAASLGLTGHAITGAHPRLATTLDTLHVLGAGSWLGTLVVVLLVGIGAAERRGVSGTVRGLVDAFSRIALAAAGVVVATGVVSAWLRLGRVSALWGSDYGRILLLKLGAFVVVLLLGAYNWRRVTPRLGERGGATRLRRSASVELLCAAVVVAITAALIMSPLPDEAPSTSPGAPAVTAAPR